MHHQATATWPASIRVVHISSRAPTTAVLVVAVMVVVIHSSGPKLRQVHMCPRPHDAAAFSSLLQGALIVALAACSAPPLAPKHPQGNASVVVGAWSRAGRVQRVFQSAQASHRK